MDTLTKLGILAEAARFDAACTSSGVNRGPAPGKLGIASSAGCCHTFTADGRCISLLKVLMSNACSYTTAHIALIAVLLLVHVPRSLHASLQS